MGSIIDSALREPKIYVQIKDESGNPVNKVGIHFYADFGSNNAKSPNLMKFHDTDQYPFRTSQ